MNKKLTFDYYNNFNSYLVVLTYKPRMRRILYSFNKEENTFYISSPYFVSQKEILKDLDKFADKLISKAKVRRKPISKDKVFIYGIELPIVISGSNEIKENEVNIKSNDDLIPLLKKEFNKYVNEKVNYFTNLMGVEKYKVKVHQVTSRYGSNSRHSKSMYFSLGLVHFKKPIIDSVIIHELAHITYYNHGKEFYDYVLKYCPEYMKYKKILDGCLYEQE